jgi:hypothetical protein
MERYSTFWSYLVTRKGNSGTLKFVGVPEILEVEEQAAKEGRGRKNEGGEAVEILQHHTAYSGIRGSNERN